MSETTKCPTLTTLTISYSNPQYLGPVYFDWNVAL